MLPCRGVSEAVAANVGVPVKGITLEEALQLGMWPGWVAPLISTDNQVSFAKAQRELHWDNFKGVTMLEDVARGSYKA